MWEGGGDSRFAVKFSQYADFALVIHERFCCIFRGSRNINQRFLSLFDTHAGSVRET